MNAFSTRRRAAFTLVELLTVIVIIGILAGLITAAAIPARNAARRAVIKTEITQLELALDAYKNKYGDYPPDFFGIDGAAGTYIQSQAQAAVLRHLRKAFPRYALSGDAAARWAQFKQNVQGYTATTDNPAGLNVDTLNPSTALVFWLGGLPADPSSSSTKLVGFSADPANPFNPSTTSLLPQLFEFDETRLTRDSDTKMYSFHPNDVAGLNTPYVYFKARMIHGKGEYGFDNGSGVFTPFAYDLSAAGTQNICTPYIEDAWDANDSSVKYPDIDATDTTAHVRKWANPKTFQILSAGLDGEFGDDAANPFRFLPSEDNPGGENITEGDYDNLTNFLDGQLEDSMP